MSEYVPVSSPVMHCLIQGIHVLHAVCLQELSKYNRIKVKAELDYADFFKPFPYTKYQFYDGQLYIRKCTLQYIGV